MKNILLENYKERFPLAPILCYYLVKGIREEGDEYYEVYAHYGKF